MVRQKHNIGNNSENAWKNWYHYKHNTSPSEKHLKIYHKFLYFLRENNCKKVLEIGCGEGDLMHLYDDIIPSSEVIGIDFTRNALISAMAKNNDRRTEFVHGTVYNLPFKNNSFDAVIIIDLFHHLTEKMRVSTTKNVIKSLKEVIRVSNNNSCILIWDLYLKYKICSYLIHWATLICSEFKIQISLLQITNGIIISFFTSKELNDILKKLQIISNFTETEKTIFPYFTPSRYLFMGKVEK